MTFVTKKVHYQILNYKTCCVLLFQNLPSHFLCFKFFLVHKLPFCSWWRGLIGFKIYDCNLNPILFALISVECATSYAIMSVIIKETHSLKITYLKRNFAILNP